MCRLLHKSTELWEQEDHTASGSKQNSPEAFASQLFLTTTEDLTRVLTLRKAQLGMGVTVHYQWGQPVVSDIVVAYIGVKNHMSGDI